MDELRIYIVFRKDLEISQPKFGIQCAHAALTVWISCLKSNPDLAWQYFTDAQPKIVLQVKDSKALLRLHTKAHTAGFCSEYIIDAGRTEFTGPTLTCIAIGPIWFPNEAKLLLKRIQLYKEDQ